MDENKFVSSILVPIDFSDPATGALRQAKRMAEAFDAELVLLYVIEPIAYPAELGVVVNLEDDLEDRALAELKKLEAENLAGIRKVTTLVKHGTANTEIVGTAEELGVDMIILGTHGYAGLTHLLLGSTAERVVRTSKCPVLTVRCPNPRK